MLMDPTPISPQACSRLRGRCAGDGVNAARAFRLSVEMPFCEGAAGSRFQVLLEPSGVSFVSELNDHVRPPRSVLRRMGAVPVVVPGQPSLHVTRDSDVIPRNTHLCLEDVDESFRHHPSCGGKFIALGNTTYLECGQNAKPARFQHGQRPEWIADLVSPP